MDVSHLLPRQQPADRGVHLSVCDPLAGDDPAVWAVGFEGQRQVAELFGKSRAGILRALFPVDEYRTRRRIPVQPMERVVGKKDAVLLAFPELPQAGAAGAVA